LQDEANRKQAPAEEKEGDSSSEEGGTEIYKRPEPTGDNDDDDPDRFKNRKGGCFVCEVNKPYGRKQGNLLMRGYLPNRPFYPGGEIEIETEILHETKDARIMTESGKEMKVWIETAKGKVLKNKIIRSLEDKELRPMGLDLFRDARFTWKLPEELELTKKTSNIKHSLCMDLVGQNKKVLRFRWPIEEVSNTKSVIKMSTGKQGPRDPPKAGSVGALLQERKSGKTGTSSSTSAGNSPALGKPPDIAKPVDTGKGKSKTPSDEPSSEEEESSNESTTSGDDSEKKKSASSEESDD